MNEVEAQLHINNISSIITNSGQNARKYYTLLITILRRLHLATPPSEGSISQW